MTPVISVATVFSQFPLAGLIPPSQARREKVTTDLTTELCKSGIINLIHTLKEFHLLEKNTSVSSRQHYLCQLLVTVISSVQLVCVRDFICTHTVKKPVTSTLRNSFVKYFTHRNQRLTAATENYSKLK